MGAILFVLIFAIAMCCSCGSSDDVAYDSDTETEAETTEVTTTTKALIEQEMPENEHIFVNEFDSRPSEIIVKNPTDTAYYMKFEDKDGKTVFSFFVRPQSEAPMYMGLGTYYLKYACGTTWYGEDDLFGENTQYAKDEEDWPFEANKVWTLTLQKQVGGNVHTEEIDEDEF